MEDRPAYGAEPISAEERLKALEERTAGVEAKLAELQKKATALKFSMCIGLTAALVVLTVLMLHSSSLKNIEQISNDFSALYESEVDLKTKQNLPFLPIPCIASHISLQNIYLERPALWGMPEGETK